VVVIETRDLKKAYGSGPAQVEALRGIDLKIGAGELVAIMGPSGSGKSTLLSLLGGVDVPSDGQVLLEGRDLATMDDDERTLARRRRIGFVFQSFNLLPTLTAEENVALPLELDGVRAGEARRRAAEALEHVEMSARRGHLPGQMSGGEQQRVAVARALVIEPALLLADEPTGNLDTTNGRRIMNLLKRVVDERGQTLIMVTHDPDIAAYAHRLISLCDGRIASDGPMSAHVARSTPGPNRLGPNTLDAGEPADPAPEPPEEPSV
jgi:putative ABC transport system ATP-binding protein